MNWIPGWVKSWIVGSLKKIAVGVVQKEGDSLQAKLKAAVVGEGDACRLCDKLDKVIDEAQRRTLVLAASSGPSWAFLKPLRAKIGEEITAHGDKLQKKLREEIKAKGPGAVDAVFDRAQEALIKNIEALSI